MKTYKVITSERLVIVVQADSYIEVLKELHESGYKPVSITELNTK